MASGGTCPARAIAHRAHNVDAVKRIIASQCALTRAIKADHSAEQLWETLNHNHQALLAQMRPLDRQELGAGKQLIAVLDARYHDSRHKQVACRAGLNSPDHCGSSAVCTLASALQGAGNNCYSLSVLYYLHCRLAGVDANICAAPGHVMLCLRDCACTGDDVIDVYDPMLRSWVPHSYAARQIETGAYVVIAESQLTALLAFNIGTAAASRGQLAVGDSFLRIAIDQGFPFADAVHNLCVIHTKRKAFTVVARLASNYLASQPANGRLSAAETRHASPRIDRANKSVSGLRLLLINALVESGRREDAIIAGEELVLAGEYVDFQHYRLYLDLKDPKGARSSSRSFLPRKRRVSDRSKQTSHTSHWALRGGAANAARNCANTEVAKQNGQELRYHHRGGIALSIKHARACTYWMSLVGARVSFGLIP